MSKNDKFLEDLFYGRITPWEIKLTDITGGKQLLRKIDKDHTYLDSVLSESDRMVLDHMLELLSRLALSESFTSFKNGYRLGGKAVLAVKTRGKHSHNIHKKRP